MWTIQESCQELNTDEQGLFVRSHRVYGKPHNKPVRDYQTYVELGVIPPYVNAFIEYQRTVRAVG